MIRTTYTTKTRLLDSVLGVALLAIAFWFLHLRAAHSTGFGWPDFGIVAVLAGVAVAIGWRDRLPALTKSASTLLRRGSRADQSDGS